MKKLEEKRREENKSLFQERGKKYYENNKEYVLQRSKKYRNRSHAVEIAIEKLVKDEKDKKKKD